MKYPAIFSKDQDGGFVVTFRDIPEAITQGDTEEEAMAMAEDVLLGTIDWYLDQKKAIPAPSKGRLGDRLVELPVSVTAKVMLLNEMLAQKVRPVDLSRKMGVRAQDITRILNLRHNTKIDTVSAAFKALGKSIEIRVS